MELCFKRSICLCGWLVADALSVELLAGWLVGCGFAERVEQGVRCGFVAGAILASSESCGCTEQASQWSALILSVTILLLVPCVVQIVALLLTVVEMVLVIMVSIALSVGVDDDAFGGCRSVRRSGAVAVSRWRRAGRWAVAGDCRRAATGCVGAVCNCRT